MSSSSEPALSIEAAIGSCSPRDCLAAMRELPGGSIDHVITDPPYEPETHYGQVQARRAERSRFLESVSVKPGLSFEPLSDETRSAYAQEMVRVSRGWVLVFCQVEALAKWKLALESAGAAYKRAAVWVKPNAMPQFSGDRPGQGYEVFVCAWASPGRSVWNAGGKVGVYFHPIPRGEDRFHETQKPFSLMREIVQDFTKKDELILDPFAGSGTTLLAAKKLDRRFIGFEQNPEYCRIVNERLADPYFLPDNKRSVSQLSLI